MVGVGGWVGIKIAATQQLFVFTFILIEWFIIHVNNFREPLSFLTIIRMANVSGTQQQRGFSLMHLRWSLLGTTYATYGAEISP